MCQDAGALTSGIILVEDSKDTHLFQNDVEVEAEKVDWNGVLACVVLLHSSEERLREEEATHPEHWRRFRLVPVLQEPQTSQEVIDVAAQWLQ